MGLLGGNIAIRREYMPTYTRSQAEDQRLAHEWYEQVIKAEVEPEHIGELVAIDLDTGRYELGADLNEVLDKVKALTPDVLPFVLRVGSLVAL